MNFKNLIKYFLLTLLILFSGCYSFSGPTDYSYSEKPYRSSLELVSASKVSDNKYSLRLNYWINEANDSLTLPSNVCRIFIHDRCKNMTITSYSVVKNKYGTFYFEFDSILKTTDHFTSEEKIEIIPPENIAVILAIGSDTYYYASDTNSYKLIDYLK